MRAAPFALAAFEVAVAGRGTALARRELVGIHCQAHAAARLTPLEARLSKDLIEAFGFGLLLDLAAAGHDHRADVVGNFVSVGDLRGGAEIFDAGVRAGADENAIDRHLRDRSARCEVHVVERSPGGLFFVFGGERLGIGHAAGDRYDLTWVGSPGDLRGDVGGVERERPVVGRVRVGRKLLPSLDGSVEILRDILAAAEIVVGGLVRGDQSGTGAGFDRHVTDGHSLFHAQRADGGSGVFDAVAGAAVGGDLADEVEDQVLGGYADGQLAVDPQFQRLGFVLEQCLRGEDVLDFAGADPEGECAQRAVGRGVTVTADDRHARLREAQLRPDDVHNALLGIVEVEQPDAKFATVFAQRVDLLFGNQVDDRQRPIGGRNVVIGRGDGQFGSSHAAASEAEALERLRAGHLVDKLPVDVEDRLPSLVGVDDVIVPDFFKERAGAVRWARHGRCGCFALVNSLERFFGVWHCWASQQWHMARKALFYCMTGVSGREAPVSGRPPRLSMGRR